MVSGIIYAMSFFSYKWWSENIDALIKAWHGKEYIRVLSYLGMGIIAFLLLLSYPIIQYKTASIAESVATPYPSRTPLPKQSCFPIALVEGEGNSKTTINGFTDNYSDCPIQLLRLKDNSTGSASDVKYNQVK